MNSLLRPVVVCFGFLPALVGAMDLSGKVLGVDRKPLGGVQVRLAASGSVAITDSTGAWSIQSRTTGTGFAGKPEGPPPRVGLVVENGRLRLRIAGRDFAGRGRDGFRGSIGRHRPAARSLGGPDSLIYSLGGRILLRDTVSASRTGIVRIIDSTFNPSLVYGFLDDSRDGRIYRTVKIGRQMWMAENLNFRNGGGADSGRWYNDSPDSGAKYGRLYTWAASMGLSDSCDTKTCARRVAARHRGLCPDGWHVPSLAEWDTLLRVAGVRTASGRGLKSVDGWIDNGGGVDAFGFRALPGGNVLPDSNIIVGRTGHWWSATEFQQEAEADAWQGYMAYNGTTANRMNHAKWRGSSLRCVQMDTSGYEGGSAPAGMKLVPAGSFTMGNPDAEGAQFEAEMPHRVTLGAFWMDSTLVTQGQYRSVTGLEPSYFVNCGADCPVERVTWFDAILYCNARSKREGLALDTVYAYTSRTIVSGIWVTALTGLSVDLSRSGYRLPTEAQWEYAARGGTATAYFWGADSSVDSVSKYAWFTGLGGSAPQRVATKSSNPWGLYDMGGNLRQWTSDWYGPYPVEEQVDPEGPTTGTFRVVRGGGQSGGVLRLRPAARDLDMPSTVSYGMGFRTVRPAR